MSRNRSSLERGNRQAWVLGVIVVLLVVALAGLVVVGTKEVSDARTAADRRAAIVAAQQAEITCIAEWANTVTSRMRQVSGANTDRIAALDTLVRSLRRHDAPVAFQRALARYLAASDAYRRAARNKPLPLPPAPQFLCDQIHAANLRLPAPEVVTVTMTAAPRPAPARTVLRTRTRIVTVPGPTRYVSVPGPVRTRTVTVTVAPGKGHR